MRGSQRVNCVLFHCVLCVLYTVSALLCIALLCRAIQKQRAGGEISVVYTQVSPPIVLLGNHRVPTSN
ncbi:unnamed protein product, partial [Staurois parvus]